MLCGQKEDIVGGELWQQDIIVVTAGNSVFDATVCLVSAVTCKRVRAKHNVMNNFTFPWKHAIVRYSNRKKRSRTHRILYVPLAVP